MYKAIIVDDEEMIRSGIKAMVPWPDIEIEKVITAASGKEAIEIIGKEMPQIMLTDICMVEMNGLDLIEQARKINPKIKIIVLTGYDDFSYAQKCCKLNVQDFILKPADEEELLNSIKSQVCELNLEAKMVHQQQLMIRVKGITEQAELENYIRRLLTDNVSQIKLLEFCEKYNFSPEQVIQVAIIIPVIDGQKEWKEYHDFLH